MREVIERGSDKFDVADLLYRQTPLSLESMLRQRIYGLALGYEDLNNYDSLRKDLLWQSAALFCSCLERFSG